MIKLTVTFKELKPGLITLFIELKGCSTASQMEKTTAVPLRDAATQYALQIQQQLGHGFSAHKEKMSPKEVKSFEQTALKNFSGRQKPQSES
ncbi:MAG TPA: hypothetical protein VFG51_02225 [Candidatus Saccharimonadia bacterium]|nr:hypothetical protein [Candidatus Saccharimonadia bacterium]